MKARWRLKLALALGAPLLFLALLEVGLALAGVEVPRFQGLGDRDRYWLPYAAEGKPAGFERSIKRKFRQFHEQPPLFVRDKPANGWRVFVLGESTVQGYPYETGSFADWLRLRATAMLPDRTVEVVNAGNCAWNAAEIRPLLQECLDHQPDLLIWMVGHNEYMAPNVLSLRYEVEHPVLHGLRSLALKLRTTEFVSRFVPDLQGRRPDVFDCLMSAELPVFGPELPLLKERFQELTAGAVADARAAGVPILLCTMPRDVREWQPTFSYFSETTRNDPALRARWDEAWLAGVHALEAGDAGAALPAFQQALALDAVPAKLHFALGQTFEKLGDEAAARASYLQALEQDAGPTRALAWQEETIRAVAADTGAPLVDLEELFNKAGKLGLAGAEMMTDNCHPDLHGHELIASAIIDLLERDLHVPFDRSRDIDPTMAREQFGATAQEGVRAQHEQSVAATQVNKVECLNLTKLALQSGMVGNAWKKANEKCMAVLAIEPKEYEVVGALGFLESIAGHTAKAKVLIQQAIDNNLFVKTQYVILWKTLPQYERAFAAAGVDMVAVEASLLPQQRAQVEDRIKAR